jgi:processive 1,2-diacylglycerol beta-glucosyltransferase
MKVLILSCNTGQGHNAAARAVEKIFKERGIDCDLKDTLSFGKVSTSDVISNIYMKMTSNIPWLFRMLYKAGDFVSSRRGQIPSPIYLANTKYANSLYHYIMKNNYDIVLCPHLFPAEAVTYIKRHYNPPITTGFIATDYSCTPFTEETEMDWYFIPHKDISSEYIKKGVPEKKIIPTGIPVLSKFRNKTDKMMARKFLRLGQDSEIFLIMTGSMGFWKYY